MSRDCAAAILEAVPALMRVVRRHMRSHRMPGTSVPQFRILGFLDRDGPATLSSAAEHVGTTLPSMSRMTQSLVEGRLVRRRGGAPDRRTVRLEITPRGRRVLEVARQATVRQLALRVGTLEPDERERLRAAMDLLLRVAAADHDRRRPQVKESRC